MLIGFRQRKFRSCRVVRRRKSGGWTGDSSSEELSNIFTQAPQQSRQAGETEEQLRLNYLSLVEPPPDYEVL